MRRAAPRRARRFLPRQPGRAKTDKWDSRGLALLGRAGSRPASPLKQAQGEQLAQWLWARRRLSTTIAQFQQQHSELPQTQAGTAGALGALPADLKAWDKPMAALTPTPPPLPPPRPFSRGPAWDR